MMGNVPAGRRRVVRKANPNEEIGCAAIAPLVSWPVSCLRVVSYILRVVWRGNVKTRGDGRRQGLPWWSRPAFCATNGQRRGGAALCATRGLLGFLLLFFSQVARPRFSGADFQPLLPSTPPFPGSVSRPLVSLTGTNFDFAHDVCFFPLPSWLRRRLEGLDGRMQEPPPPPMQIGVRFGVWRGGGTRSFRRVNAPFLVLGRGGGNLRRRTPYTALRSRWRF